MGGIMLRRFGVQASGLIFGNTDQTVVTNLSAAQDNQQGAAWQASVSGTLNYISIAGHQSNDYTTNYRLCIYAATNQTTWSGALLGETAVQSVLNHGTVVKAALLSPVSITAGNWYAITVQPDAPGMACGATSGGQGDRFFGDTYSDGAAGTAGASAFNASDTRCIFASAN